MTKRHRTIVTLLGAVGALLAALAFAAPVPVDTLPSAFGTVTSQQMLHAFRQAAWNQFYKDAVWLDNWSAPTGTTGWQNIDSNPSIAVAKFVQFLVLLKNQNQSGLYDLLAERHDSGMQKIGQAFAYAHGNVQGAVDYTMNVQGVSRYLASDNVVANNAAVGIDALLYLQASWCDVDPAVAWDSWQKAKVQFDAAGLVMRPYACAAPGPTPTPSPPGPTPTPTPTPPPGSTPTPTPTGQYTVTIGCNPPLTCSPIVVNVPPSGLTLTLAPK